MKKVGILNFQYSTHNYGAVLQAAALEAICRRLGHEAEHLDYMARQKISFKSRVGQFLRKVGLRKASGSPSIANSEAFEKFRREFLRRTPRIYSSRDFYREAGRFDAVIVGSDQVWRPEFARDAIAFFLGYVPHGVDRISYAASFGTETWGDRPEDAEITGRVREELRRFRAISCREESGVAICKQVFGVEAAHVLDPLLLVEDEFLDGIVSRSSVSPGARVVYYKLDPSEEFQADLAVIGQELGSTAVNIYLQDSQAKSYREVWDWLALIKKSDVVVTDSFHCICLALRFGKEVIFCPNEKRGKTRLDSLFKKLDVDSRPIEMALKTPMMRLFPRDSFDGILERERAYSMGFLRDALHG